MSHNPPNLKEKNLEFSDNIVDLNKFKNRRPPGGNWLKDYKVGTAFAARPREPVYKDPALMIYEVLFHGNKVTRLAKEDGTSGLVDTERFSVMLEPVEVLYEGRDDEPDREPGDSPGKLAGHEGAESVPGPVQEKEPGT